MANYNPYQQTDRYRVSNAAAMKKLYAGRSPTEYRADLARKMAPSSPLQHAAMDVRSNSSGDKGYQMEEVNQRFQSDAGKKEMSDFYKKNDQWFNPNGERTNKGFTPDEIMMRNSANAGTVAALRNPPPVAAPAPQVAPVPVQPSQVQQNMNQPIVTKPVQNFNATQQASSGYGTPVQQSNSGWTGGGWGK